MKERGNNFEVKYHPLVVKKDIPQLSKSNKKRVKQSIERKLNTHPQIFGQPLRKSLKGYRKLRVGDYRIIFKIRGQIIYILFIGHRSIIYREVDKRMTGTD